MLYSLWYHHTYRWPSRAQINLNLCTKFYNKFIFKPLHVSSTCAHHQEGKIVLHSLWYHHTYRWLSSAQIEIPLSTTTTTTITTTTTFLDLRIYCFF